MAQLFTPRADSWLRLSLAVIVVGLVSLVSTMLILARSPYVTGQNIAPSQPIPFSHQHHVADIGIDCRYCHATVESSASAGLPTSEVCMNCHRELWSKAEMLEPVRASFRDDTPIAWTRVHDLPDYVYFNHSVHIHSGIGCYSCHGDLGEMPLTRQAAPLTMQWCLDCHRNPTPHMRPPEYVFITRPLGDIPRADKGLASQSQGQTAHPANINVATNAMTELPTDLQSNTQANTQANSPLDVRRLQDCCTCHR